MPKRQRMFFRWDGARWVLKDASQIQKEAQTPAAPRPVRDPTPRINSKKWLIPARRWDIIIAADYTCTYCGDRGSGPDGPDGQRWHIDHVVPLSRGGETTWDNLVLACQACNLAKGSGVCAVRKRLDTHTAAPPGEGTENTG